MVITATAANITQEQAIAMAARNGRISFFGGLPKTNPTITCDSNLVHYRQLHIHGANGSAPVHNKKALEYIASGVVPVKDLITVHLRSSGRWRLSTSSPRPGHQGDRGALALALGRRKDAAALRCWEAAAFALQSLPRRSPGGARRGGDGPASWGAGSVGERRATRRARGPA